MKGRCIKDDIKAVWEKQGGKSQTGIKTRKRKEKEELAMNLDCAISAVFASNGFEGPNRSNNFTRIQLVSYFTAKKNVFGFVFDPLMASGGMVERV